MRVYHSWFQAMNKLSNSERGRLVLCMMSYDSDGDAEKAEAYLSGNESFAWEWIKPQIDVDKAKYEDIQEKRSKAGKSSHGKCNQMISNDNTCYHMIPNEKEKEKEIEKENEKEIEREMEKENETVALPEATDAFADFAAGDPDLLNALREYADRRQARFHVGLTEAEQQKFLKSLADIPVDRRIPAVREAAEKGWKTCYDHSDRKIPGKNNRSAPVNIPPQDPRKLKALVDLI